MDLWVYDLLGLVYRIELGINQESDIDTTELISRFRKCILDKGFKIHLEEIAYLVYPSGMRRGIYSFYITGLGKKFVLSKWVKEFSLPVYNDVEKKILGASIFDRDGRSSVSDELLTTTWIWWNNELGFVREVRRPNKNNR